MKMFSDNYFTRRWHGRIPLATLLWRDMLGIGTAVNVIATVLALVVVIRDAPSWYAVALHLLPMPYNIFLFAAVWRMPNRNVFVSLIAVFWLIAVVVV